MIFNSLEFLIFFPVTTLGYFLLKGINRIIWLLLASCFFYMFFLPKFILILLLVIVVDYFSGLAIGNADGRLKKRVYLIVSLSTNISILVFFKYANFIIENINYVSGQLHSHHYLPMLSIILPIGLSFHTFQAMSYTIEVYKGRQAPEKNFLIYALYVLYYPQLVAGPIERPQNLLEQFKQNHKVEYYRMTSGLKLMLWGMFKKVVIADRCAQFVDIVYGNVYSYKGFPLIWTTLFFSVQIYCDFSGYSDIARGCSRVMGIELMKNFNFPYFSRSIREFWTRWHISLSTWFKDYVYIPLGGSKTTKWKWSRNIMIVFLISGLWHGASWTFVIWGALHGLLSVSENLTGMRLIGSSQKLVSFIKWVYCFVIVSLIWVFFRAGSFQEAIYILRNIFEVSPGNLVGVANFTKQSFLLIVLLVIFLFVLEYLLFKGIAQRVLKLRIINYIVVGALITIIYLFGVFEDKSFIYFQF